MTRVVRDAELKLDISRIHQGNHAVHGARKLWRQLRREDTEVGRDQFVRLMRGSACVAVRGKRVRTTVPAHVAERPADLVNRTFGAPAPNRLWVPT